MHIQNFAEDQQLSLADAQALARDPRDLADALAKTAIESGTAYAGGTVAKTGGTRVTVATPLYLYVAGALFSREDAGGIEIDLLSVLPVAGNKRIVAIVLQGQESDDAVEERDFLVNAATEEVEARPTATRVSRRALVATVAGAAAPDPTKPVIDAALLPLAYVTLSPTEVLVDGIEQVTANRLATLRAVDGRLQTVEIWRDATQPVIDGIKSDVAGLAGLTSGKVSRQLFAHLMENVARLNERIGLAGEPALAVTDYFLDTSQSDVEDPVYLAKVEEGLRFDDAHLDTLTLALNTPADGRILVHGDGLILPHYVHQTLMSVWGKDAEQALSNAGAQTVEYKKRTVARKRLRWGQVFKICTNNAFWQTGRYDPVTHIFSREGDTFIVLNPAKALANHQHVRLQKFWYDTYNEIYWDTILVTASYTGNVAGQTFLMPSTRWVTHLNLGFSRLDSSGAVRLMITRVNDAGAPDPKNVLSDVNIPFASLKLYPARTEVNIPPILLKGGERYAIVLSTPANHWAAMVQGNKYGQGTFFLSTDGSWFQGNIAIDMAFELVCARFDVPQLTVALDNWHLDGGLGAVDLSVETITPEVAGAIVAMAFEARVGGAWYTIGEVGEGTNHPLFGQPSSVDARMTFIGTTDVMPGIVLPNSQVTLSRSRTAFTHVSTERLTPVAVDEVHLVATMEGWDGAHHTIDARLLTGPTFATTVSPSATTDEVLPDGSLRRTWVFAGLTPLTSFKRKFIGGTDSALSVFHVAEATDFAFPAP